MGADLTKIAAQVMAAIHASGASKELDFTAEIIEAAKSKAYDVMTNYDWAILRRSTTVSGGSVNGQSTYTLSGTSANPCGRPITVNYATYPIDYVEPEDFDLRIAGADASNYDISMWTLDSYNSQGFPVIKFFGTPSQSGDEIFYRYQVRIDEADPLEKMPGHMLEIVRLKLLSEFYPYPDKSAQFRDEAENKVNNSLWTMRVKGNLSKRGVISRDRMQGNIEANRFASRNHRSYISGS